MLATLVNDCKEHVGQLFEQSDTTELIYHNYLHTHDVVQRIRFLSSDLNKEEQDLLQIAGWFHDVGYLYAYDHHEDRGMLIAASYLKKKQVAQKHIDLITGCIEATKMHLQPRNNLENIIKDADIGFGVTENFFKTGPQLRKEWALKLQKTYSNSDWETLQLQFLSSISFYSSAAKKHYQPILTDNILKQKMRLK